MKKIIDKVTYNLLTSIKDFKWLFVISFLIFIGGLVFGMNIEVLTSDAERSSSISSFIDYFARNFSIIIITAVIGFITFGIAGIFVLFINGVVVGESFALTTNFISNSQTLLLLVPHGIFEITAFCLAGAINFLLLRNVLIKIFTEQQRKFISKGDLKNILHGVLIISLLTFLAATIEFYFTPSIEDFL
ncbi:stage II sporulation protein M [Bacillus sp. A116_S68]|nr:stage II sporulation protein M [Bacillus sp. A116_S68]